MSISSSTLCAPHAFRVSFWSPHPRSLTSNLTLPPSNSAVVSLAASSRGKKKTSITTAKTRKNSKTTPPLKLQKENEEDDIDEDAFEALFSQLEEDLKNDGLLDDEDDEITEEDLARLEKELEEAFGDGELADILDDAPSGSEELDTDEESDEEERLPTLKNWQLRRLARALKIGRRKTNIKNLSAELGLDRAFVLDVLHDPPPTLLLLSESLPDEVQQILQSEREPLENVEAETHDAEIEESEPPDVVPSGADSKPDAKLPVHVMRTKWAGRKRLKKVQVETLERVYMRTKRPTNAMISNVVHVTNLPWKTVVKWFEDKRTEDGVPERRVPFRRPVPVD